MPLVLLNNKLWFPPLEYATPEGLLAVGGDLSTERLILAYRSGIFPWFDEEGPLLWWSPNPRFVLFPEHLKLRRSLRKVMRQDKFTIKVDKRFGDVIRACAKSPRKDQGGTWITDDMIRAYEALHELGLAHSVETYYQDQLVGGLYGIAMGPFFFGESMFHTKSDASKMALAALVYRYKSGVLIDCQVENDFFKSMGASYIPRSQFTSLLKNHLEESPCWSDTSAAIKTSLIEAELPKS